MTAMSPDLSRLVKSLVRPSMRTVPRTPGISGSRGARRRRLMNIVNHRVTCGACFFPHTGAAEKLVTRSQPERPAATTSGMPQPSPRDGWLQSPSSTCCRRCLAVFRSLSEKLLGVLDSHAGVLNPAHHPGKLAQLFLPSDSDHSAGGDVPVVGLANDQMTVCVGSDLGQVGHDDHLSRCSQGGQP